MSRSPTSNPPAEASAAVWLVDAHEVDEAVLAFFARQLAPDAAQRHARFVSAVRRRQFVLGRMLLRR